MNATARDRVGFWTSGRRPLHSYIAEQNTDFRLSPGKLVIVRPSIWFTRARWFAAGAFFALALVAAWSI